MKIFWAILSLFCVTSTMVAHDELPENEVLIDYDEYLLDQYLEENSENFSQKELDLINENRGGIISRTESIIYNSPQIEDFINAIEDSINYYLTAVSYSGDWMWFGAFPWVYSSKYESWLYLYPNLDVSIYGENGYARKDSNYCTKMNWVWVVREDYIGDGEYQSKFAYSNDEKAWLHFKQRDEEELYSYCAKTQEWKNFGGEMFNWLHDHQTITSTLIDDYKKDDLIQKEDKSEYYLTKNGDLIKRDAYKPGDVITQDTEIQMIREFEYKAACPVCAPYESTLEEIQICECEYRKGYQYYYRSPTTSEIENQQIEGFYYVGEVKYLGLSPYQDPNGPIALIDLEKKEEPKVLQLDPEIIKRINQETLNTNIEPDSQSTE